LSNNNNIVGEKFTSCKDCKFAIWDGNTQIGCEQGVLDKYNNIIEAYDEEKEFNIINNDVCLLKRSLSSKCSLEDARKEISIRYNAIIIYKDWPKSNKKLLEKSIKSLVDQEIKPSSICIIAPFGLQLDIDMVTGLLKKYDIKNWKVECQLNPDTMENYIDRFVETTNEKQPWYLVMNSDFILPKDYLSQINKRYILDLEQFGLVKPLDEERNGLLVKTIFHAYLGGSRNNLIENKFNNTYIYYEKK
jgi:hypothetical protein